MPRKRIAIVKCRACRAVVTLRVDGSFEPDQQCRRCGRRGTVRARFMSQARYRRRRRQRRADNAVRLKAGSLREKLAGLAAEIDNLRKWAGVLIVGPAEREHQQNRIKRLRRVMSQLYRRNPRGPLKRRSPWRGRSS